MSQKTPLHAAHLQASAKMIDFAGWEMPIHYGSQISEHLCVRRDAGMFDVSHMTVIDVGGVDARAYLRHLLANDIAKFNRPGQALYSCMLNEQGGILDDLIVYWLNDAGYRVVINSATRDKGLHWFKLQAAKFAALTLTTRDDIATIAVQGPNAREKVLSLFQDAERAVAENLSRFTAATVGHYFIARTGYSGEDGFELSMPSPMANDCWQKLCTSGVKPCGLGARDTLRLEAGMCLYGTDMDETTSPLVSALGWTVAMDDERHFIGKKALLEERTRGVEQKLIGLFLKDKGVLRNHLKVLTDQGEGEVTSGSYSPTLGLSIALARVPKAAQGEVSVAVRNRLLKAEITTTPFVRQGKSCIT